MTNFPTALDALTNPLSTDGLTGHASQHANENDAIEALQAKVGVDGSLVATSLDYKVAALEASRELTANKGVAGGYAGLDGTGKVPAAQLPSYVDDVVEYANLAAFPATGETAKIYVALDTEKIYRWSGSAYVEISPSPGSTDSVTEGATNLYFTAQRVRDAVLTGLSTATNAVIAATDSALVALGKLQAQITTKAANADIAGHITGLWMEWNSGTSISITSGACYIHSLGRVSVVPATLTLSSLSLSASTWYHLYLYESAGTPAIEIVTTAPAAAYSGTARAKTGDTSRRYLGSVKTDSGGSLISVQQVGPLVLYRNDVIANLIVPGGGTSTTSAAVDSSTYVPTTSFLAMILHYNAAPNAFVFISNSNSVSVPAAYLSAVAPSTYLDSDTLLNSSQQFTYAYTAAPTGGGAYYPRVKGYTYYR